MRRTAWAAILVAVSCLAVLAIANRREVNIDVAELPPCPRPGHYLRASELARQAAIEIAASRLQKASQLLDQGLTVLGTRYDPHQRTFDDTGQSLVAASAMGGNGASAAGVRYKQEIFASRLRMQVDPRLCNRTVTRIVWW